MDENFYLLTFRYTMSVPMLGSESNIRNAYYSCDDFIYSDVVDEIKGGIVDDPKFVQNVVILNRIKVTEKEYLLNTEGK